MNVFTEASLSDSYMFKQLNGSSSLTTKVASAVGSGTVLDKTFIEEQYLQVTKTRISPISEKVLRAFDDGRVKLIYNKAIRLTTALPFIVLDMGGRPTACIFISDFSGVNKEGTALTIEMKKLYTLMESAYVGLHYFTTPQKFLNNGGFLKTNAQIYSAMMLRNLNREYALSLDKDVYDAVNYACSYFFLQKMGMKNVELMHSYASATCNNPSPVQLEITKESYQRARVESIEDLIKFIAKQSLKMEKLTLRYFFERWIAAFGQGACLAIDSWPYMNYVIANVLMGSFLVNVAGLSDVIKNTKGIINYYSEISRLV